MGLQNLGQVFVTMTVVLFLGPPSSGAPAAPFQYGDPSCGGRQVLVQLFQWKWRSVARECEDFLGPWGFCGVQVSVPTEHVIAGSPPNPWWQHYQPVSYKLESRFGTEQEFTDMVVRCNARGVRIFADVVLNNMAQRHLSGEGYNGSTFNSDTLDFPGVPFDKDDFNHLDVKCPSADGMVHDLTNPREVRDCSYEGLTDLDQSRQEVQDAIVAYLNRLIDIGVSGFRVDKATFMWPQDLAAIQRKVEDRWSGGRPLYMLHVQDMGEGAVTAEEYEDLGYVTEYRYRQLLGEAMDDFRKLRDVTSLSAGGKLVPSAHAIVFLDNHETQRQSSRPWLSFRDGVKYTLATAFMLAHDYGLVRLMSGYTFDDVNMGPPANPDGSIQDVVISDNGLCDGGWLCEHRWSTVAMLVRFRTAVARADINHWQDDPSFVAFSRGSVGFFAMTSAASYVMKVMTGLAPGTYCELVSECLSTLTVEEGGYVSLDLNAANKPVVAILADMKVEVSTTVSVHHNNANATFDISHVTSFSSGVIEFQDSTQQQHMSISDTTEFQDSTQQYMYDTRVQATTEQHTSTPETFSKITDENHVSALAGFQTVTGEPALDTTRWPVVTGEPALNSTVLQVITGEPALNSTGLQVVTGEPALDTTELQVITGEPAIDSTGLQVVTGEPALNSTGLQVVTGELALNSTGLQIVTGEPALNGTGFKGTDGQPGSIATSFGGQTFTDNFWSTSMTPSAYPLVSTEEPLPLSAEPPSSATKPGSTPLPSPLPAYRRTVILLHWSTRPGQYVFFRGGIDTIHRPGCVSNAKVDPCAIPVRDRAEGANQFFQQYNAWRLGDDFLDWYGAEQGQGTYNGQAADGSPGVWTSSNPAIAGYHPLNTYGDHYWMLDIDMDCSKTLEDGYFELKAYSSHWEPSISTHTCAGSYPPPPYTSSNHFARCGYLNVFKEGGSCEVRVLTA